MWEQTANHGARFRVSDWTLQVIATETSLDLTATNRQGRALNGCIQLSNLRLPAVSESFVRGDELHLIMPQHDGCQVGMEFMLLIVQADPQQFVLETVISLHTQQLNLHPRVVLSSGTTGLPSERWVMSPLGTSRWYSGCVHDGACPLDLAVLVDPRDRFSIDDSQSDRQQLCFFGDFMEKGVIRKVQPWWIWSCTEITPSARHQLASELANRPLPLAT